MSFLSGYRTYIIAGASAAVTFIHGIGKIDSNTYGTIMGYLGSAGLFFLRSANK